MNSMKRQNDRTLEDGPTRSVDVKYTTGEEWKNGCRRNEEAEPKWTRSSKLNSPSHYLPTTQEMTLYMDFARWSIPKSD